MNQIEFPSSASHSLKMFGIAANMIQWRLACCLQKMSIQLCTTESFFFTLSSWTLFSQVIEGCCPSSSPKLPSCSLSAQKYLSSTLTISFSENSVS